tara:strand:+ start:757 stop:972 length:216 start_codon:yes stop_codon:yes gene_type:complete
MQEQLAKKEPVSSFYTLDGLTKVQDYEALNNIWKELGVGKANEPKLFGESRRLSSLDNSLISLDVLSQQNS